MNRSGQFLNVRSGQRGISLNVRHPKGQEILRRLIAQADVVAEGFSPGVLERWGFGYEAMRKLKPDIIYAQQSGFGQQGRYGRYRTLGPVAQALGATSEMSGLPEPAPPAGWGYSYLDWFGAYTLALGDPGCAQPPRAHGQGPVDRLLPVRLRASIWPAPQCSTGRQTAAPGSATAIARRTSPLRRTARTAAAGTIAGSRSRASARRSGRRWPKVAGHPEWTGDARFASLRARLAHQDALDALVESWTRTQDALRGDAPAAGRRRTRGGVPGRVRSLRARPAAREHLEWLTEVTGSEIGTWPIAGAADRA